MCPSIFHKATKQVQQHPTSWRDLKERKERKKERERERKRERKRQRERKEAGKTRQVDNAPLYYFALTLMNLY